MHHAPLTNSEFDTWNSLVADSDDAWFWHSTDWLAFVKVVGADFFVEDLSFLIYNGAKIVAICPVILETREGYCRFTYLGEFIPFPAFARTVTPELRVKALEYYSSILKDIAVTRDVAYTRVTVPPLAPAAIGPCSFSWNFLLRHGYLDAAASTQVIVLSESENVLWENVRKGHRSDIKRASRSCETRFWDRNTITSEKFSEYRSLHARDAGRVTRASGSFEMMLDWIRRGNAVLVEASHAGTAVAFSLVIIFREGAYYASSCKEPDFKQLTAMHLIQWDTIRWLKSHGYRQYDLGPQFFGPRWDYVPTGKDISIAGFKRGFGGVTRRIDTVERFYSNSVLAQVGAVRLKSLVIAHGTRDSPPPLKVTRDLKHREIIERWNL